MDSIRVQGSKLYDRDLKFAILHRLPPAGSTPDQPKAGRAAYSLRLGSLGIRQELLQADMPGPG
jgi:hypothetical protein